VTKTPAYHEISNKSMNKESLSKEIGHLAHSAGIDALGFADTSDFPNYALSDSRRRDPKLSLQDARTIIVAGIYIGGLTLKDWTNPWYGRTSRLYLSGFFLDVVKPLETILSLLIDEGYKAIVCDSSREESSSLPLKLAAVRAGLGWQGKHSLLISKKYGTFLALGGMITNAELDHNTTEEPNLCRKCDKCQKACPLSALDQSYVLDRSKCLSHCLQMDHLPEEAQAVAENRVIDCEICQQACPWNKKHIENPLTTEMTESFQKRTDTLKKVFYLPNLVRLSEAEYKKTLGYLNTDIPYEIFHRNVLMAVERTKQIN
jgi:epoxyqueuosine reductase